MKRRILVLAAILSLPVSATTAADFTPSGGGFLHEGRHAGYLWRGPGDTPYYRVDRSGHERWSGTRHLHRHDGFVASDGRRGRQVGVVAGGRLVHPTYSYDNGYYGGDYHLVEPRIVRIR